MISRFRSIKPVLPRRYLPVVMLWRRLILFVTWTLALLTAIAVPAVAASSPNAPGSLEKDNPAITNPSASNPTASNSTASNPAESNPTASNPAESNPATNNPAESNTAAYNPTASNSTAYNSTASNPAAPPVFSRQGGFFTSEFFLQIVSGFPDAEIRYTLDGSEPGPDSRLYEGPILVRDRSKDPGAISHIRTTAPGRITMFGFQWKPPQGDNFRGSVVRARVFRPGHAPSEIITQSYFIDPAGGSRYTLPVVSIVTDSLHLFDYDTGIYVTGRVYDEQDVDDLENCDDCHRTGNYSQTGREWERPASMELFDELGDRVYQQNIGIRIHGGASRALPMKSLRLYARSDYGQSRFHFPIFPDEPYTNFNRLILRNSGQDFFVRSTMFRDAFSQELVRDLNFDTQANQPVIIFINGEYWGIQNFRERYDENYLARVWGVNPDRVDMLTDTLEVKAGSGEHYDALIRLVEENDPADPEIYRQILTMMDPDNFSDYLTAQVLVRNVDWPGNNFDLWRLQVPYDPEAPPGHDGRWRWKLVDTDAGFGLLNPWRVASYDMIRHMTNDTYDAWPNYVWSTILIRAMLRNEGFRLDFINRMSDYLNTWFQPSHVTALIDRFEDRLEPVIEDHILRWGQIESMPRWHDNVEWMRDFARRRPPYVYEHMMRHFELSRPVTIEVDVSAMHKGRVEVNRITINEDTPGLPAPESPWPWRGKYFREVPVRLTAVAYSGYKFSHWEDGETSDTGSGRRLQQALTSDEDIARMLAFYGSEAHESEGETQAYSGGEVLGSAGGKMHGSTGGKTHGLTDREAPGYSTRMLTFNSEESEGAAGGGIQGFSGGAKPYSGGEVPGSAGGEMHGSTGGTQACSGGVQAASANNLDNSTIWVMPDKGLSARAVFVPKPETQDTDGSDPSGSDSSHVRPEFDFEPHRLADAPYFFIQWDPQAEPGSFPPNMIFQYMEDEDPGLGSPPAGLTSGAFNLSSRTRINGLGNDGISFINTSNRDGNPGYPGRRLGAAVLAIDTRDMKNIWVNWTGGTVTPNSRMYHLRLQFRTHPNDPFRDVRDVDGRVVEYKRHATAGHSERFYLVRLPASADNKPRIELRWKYYYTGSQLTDVSGARDQLRLGDIQVRGEPMREHQGEPVENYRMLSNYPNPFNNATMIQVQLPEETMVTVHVFDINGRLVRVVRDNMRLSAGHHAIHFNAAGLAGGVYVYRVSTPDFTAHGKMTLIP